MPLLTVNVIAQLLQKSEESVISWDCNDGRQVSSCAEFTISKRSDMFLRTPGNSSSLSSLQLQISLSLSLSLCLYVSFFVSVALSISFCVSLPVSLSLFISVLITIKHVYWNSMSDEFPTDVTCIDVNRFEVRHIHTCVPVRVSGRSQRHAGLSSTLIQITEAQRDSEADQMWIVLFKEYGMPVG